MSSPAQPPPASYDAGGAGEPDDARSGGDTAAQDGRPPRFARRSDGRMVAGVAVALAEHLGLQPLTVRIAFSLLAALSGFGVVLYLALWLFTPLDETVAAELDDEAPAGVAAATRRGWRQRVRRSGRTGDLGQLVALGLLSVGVWWLVQRTPLGLSPAVIVPIVLIAGGLALVWRTVDETERERLSAMSSRLPWLSTLTRGVGESTVRVAVGVLVVVAGVVVFLVGQGQLQATMDALTGVLVIVAGLGLIIGPWLWRLWRSLEVERRARIVTEERADMAAHLHDSVLQTLALIQKQADDPAAVTRLARRQERDLRRWLYGRSSPDDAFLAAALTTVAAEVEDMFGVRVELVTVGDAELDDRAWAVVNAAREAAINAAKHSGADKVDLYLEVGDDGIEVFVRDRGSGFDPEQIPADRLGVRRSITDRMVRHGGQAVIRSTPGDGTEVRLAMRRSR